MENIIKYAKSSFLKNRRFTNIGLLNDQALAWLERTGNGAVHGTIQRVPSEELEKERPYLSPFFGLDQSSHRAPQAYTLRKDNTISFKGNFYSVPLGTYKGQGSKVWVLLEDQMLAIYDQDRQQVARHPLCMDKGKLISNTHHRRNNTRGIEELTCRAASHFTNPDKAASFFEAVRKVKPRYIRDQILMITRYCNDHPGNTLDQVLDFCLTNKIFSARDFGEVLAPMATEQAQHPSRPADLLHKDIDRSLYNQTPQHSSIDTYETIFSNS